MDADNVGAWREMSAEGLRTWYDAEPEGSLVRSGTATPPPPPRKLPAARAPRPLARADPGTPARSTRRVRPGTPPPRELPVPRAPRPLARAAPGTPARDGRDPPAGGSVGADGAGRTYCPGSPAPLQKGQPWRS